MSSSEKKGLSGVIPILAAVIAGAAIGAGVLLVGFRHRLEPKASDSTKTAVPAEKVAAPELAIRHLDTFILNLADNQQTYLRIGVELGVAIAGTSEKSNETAKEGEGASDDKDTPVIRDAVLEVLTNTKATEVATAEGKAALKNKIKSVLNERVPSLGVREVYFTEFLMQE